MILAIVFKSLGRAPEVPQGYTKCVSMLRAKKQRGNKTVGLVSFTAVVS